MRRNTLLESRRNSTIVTVFTEMNFNFNFNGRNRIFDLKDATVGTGAGTTLTVKQIADLKVLGTSKSTIQNSTDSSFGRAGVPVQRMFCA
jgi:hypothetical protein